MKLVVDMNLSPRWIEFLTDAGFHAVHWTEVGQSTTKDEEIIAWAAQNGHVVLTHDLDFSAILASTQDAKPSVIQLRADDVTLEAVGGKVISALHQMKSELEAGALLSLDAARTRLRILPLRKS
jgi:predicted nuclease of predicted toxin-antitoxin system